MIYVKNTQRIIRIDTVSVEHDMEQILNTIRYPDFDVTVWFTTEKTIQKYNQQFRDVNKPTDVLSFPYHTQASPGEALVVDTEDDKNLGDIMIAPTYMSRQLPDWNQTFEERLRIVLVHSVCHLLGYDHVHDADYEIMQAEENRILRAIKKSSES
jgi:probable rRNA maturation factor